MTTTVNKKYHRSIILGILLIFISIIILKTINWLQQSFAIENIKQIIYQLNLNNTNNDFDIYKKWFIDVVPISMILTFLITFLMLRIYRFFHKYRRRVYITIKSNYSKFGVVALIICIIYSVSYYNVFDYVNNMFQETNLYSSYYVDPRNVEITFPKEKKNLIHLSLESIENSYLDINNGGVQNVNYIQELTELAKDNINFSNNNKIGGALPLNGTQWTIASQVATNMAIPLTLTIDGNSYGRYEEFLPGGYALGEVLEKNGYNNEFICGSDENFAGTIKFYKQHGNYIVKGYNYFKDIGAIPSDYHFAWGIQDNKLFPLIKTEITKLVKQEKPFNLEIATIDCHAPDGYICEKCPDIYSNQYANVIACQSRQVQEFLNWCKKQSWYDNTIIVITGDHLSMAEHFFQNVDEKYVRTTYNCFINSCIEPVNEKNRKFSTMDLYPTILAALGANIEGDRLGLGTNLFSSKKTLVEILGLDTMNEELNKTSKFYNEVIIGSED